MTELRTRDTRWSYRPWSSSVATEATMLCQPCLTILLHLVSSLADVFALITQYDAPPLTRMSNHKFDDQMESIWRWFCMMLSLMLLQTMCCNLCDPQLFLFSMFSNFLSCYPHWKMIEWIRTRSREIAMNLG